MKSDKTDKAIKAALKAEAMKAAAVKADRAKLAKILNRADAKRNK